MAARPRSADDFAAIRAQMEELRRESAREMHDHELQETVGKRSQGPRLTSEKLKARP